VENRTGPRKMPGHQASMWHCYADGISTQYLILIAILVFVLSLSHTPVMGY